MVDGRGGPAGTVGALGAEASPSIGEPEPEGNEIVRRLLAVATAAWLAVGCTIGGSDPALMTLRTDPMAIYEPEGAVLDERVEDESGAVGSRRKRGHLVHRFVIQPGHDPDAIRADAIATAQEHGWEFFTDIPTASARRTIDDVAAELSIWAGVDAGRSMLVITILAV